MRLRILLVPIGFFACDKPSAPAEITPAREPAASAVASAIPSASPVPAAVPAESSAAASPTTSTTPAGAVAATTKAPTTPAKGAPSTGAAAQASASASPSPEPMKTASTRVTGKNFALDVASAGCRVALECAMTIKLNVSGEFHVNKEYPYKFTAAPSSSVAFLGKGDAMSFTRAAGDFAEQGEKTATMTVRFKPSRAGDADVSGTYKLSVCSADQCQIEQQPIRLVVPVM